MESTSMPGAIISFRDALVEILMQALQSGSTSPVRMPGFYLICLRTSATMPMAALPTERMVKAEKRQGSMAPISSPVKMSGLVRVMPILFYSPALWRKPPQRERATRQALPMANPFPMAAVVLPAASKPSVMVRTYGPIQAISAIPPALSLIGPYPSMASEMGRFDSIPKAARETPQYPISVLETYAVRAMKMTGTAVLKYPRASPNVTLEAAPARQVSASYLTGAQE